MSTTYINYAVSSFSSSHFHFILFLYTFSLQFANVHDVSWGTKGDNTVAKTLGTIATGKTGGQVEVPTDEKDIDTLYKYAIHVLNT